MQYETCSTKSADLVKHSFASCAENPTRNQDFSGREDALFFRRWGLPGAVDKQAFFRIKRGDVGKTNPLGFNRHSFVLNAAPTRF